MEYRLIQTYNSYVMGVHNYYSIATHVNPDFHKIAFDVKKSLYNRLKHRLQKSGQITNRYTKEANFVSWNGNDTKLDIRIWYPGHERCGKGVTLTEDEGRNLYEALKEIYEPE